MIRWKNDRAEEKEGNGLNGRKKEKEDDER